MTTTQTPARTARSPYALVQATMLGAGLDAYNWSDEVIGVAEFDGSVLTAARTMRALITDDEAAALDAAVETVYFRGLVQAAIRDHVTIDSASIADDSVLQAIIIAMYWWTEGAFNED